MQRVTRIAGGSFAKVCGISGVVYGLVVGSIIIGLTIILGANSAVVHGVGSLKITALFGVIQLMVMPIVSGVFHFVFGAFAAWLYNVYARRFGGVEVELESVAAGPADSVSSEIECRNSL